MLYIEGIMVKVHLAKEDLRGRTGCGVGVGALHLGFEVLRAFAGVAGTPRRFRYNVNEGRALDGHDLPRDTRDSPCYGYQLLISAGISNCATLQRSHKNITKKECLVTRLWQIGGFKPWSYNFP